MPEPSVPLNVSWWAWALFAVLVLAMLALDLRVASRGDGKESNRRPPPGPLLAVSRAITIEGYRAQESPLSISNDEIGE